MISRKNVRRVWEYVNKKYLIWTIFVFMRGRNEYNAAVAIRCINAVFSRLKSSTLLVLSGRTI